MENYFWSTKLITLRCFRAEDSEALYEYLPEKTLQLQAEHGTPLPLTVQKAEALTDLAIAETEEEENLWFAIEDSLEQMVGYATIDWMNERGGSASLCIHIFEPFRRMHYALDAFHILAAYLFFERRMHKINCCTLEGNMEGAAFAYSLGFKNEIFRSDMFYTQNKHLGEYYFGLLETEYKKDFHQSTPIPEVFLTTLPNSTLGEKPDFIYQIPVFEERPYFWSWNGITLRATTESDYLENQKILYHSQMCRFFDNDVKLPYDTEVLSEHGKSHIDFGGDDNRIEFSIINENGTYVGNVNLCGLDQKNGKFSFSFYTLPEFQGKGYATKAIQLLLYYAFTELRMHKVISCVNEGNTASAIVMRKAGLHVEGIRRENDFYDGHYIDEIFFGATKEELFY